MNLFQLQYGSQLKDYCLLISLPPAQQTVPRNVPTRRPSAVAPRHQHVRLHIIVIESQNTVISSDEEGANKFTTMLKICHGLRLKNEFVWRQLDSKVAWHTVSVFRSLLFIPRSS